MTLGVLTLMNVLVDTVPWKPIALTLLEVGHVNVKMDSLEMEFHVQVKYKRDHIQLHTSPKVFDRKSQTMQSEFIYV